MFNIEIYCLVNNVINVIKYEFFLYGKFFYKVRKNYELVYFKMKNWYIL